MIIRPAYPDELGRAKTHLNGHPIPPDASFLLLVKETPVERIIAAIPSWSAPSREEDGPETLNFHLTSLDKIELETLHRILSAVEDLAQEKGLSAIAPDFSLPEKHPLYAQLIAQDYHISQTDRYFTMPGESVVSRCQRIYQKVKNKIPTSWEVQSIRGQDPAEIFHLVSTHNLMSAQQFQKYWDSSNREHFEEDYSCVILDQGKIIATFLHTQRGEDELHIHVDAIHPDHTHFSGYATVVMRNWIVCHCSPGFPKTFTSRADSKIHTEGGNTALRYQGGTEESPRHFLSKAI